MNTGILFLVSINLLLGVAAGFIMHRSDFCVAGMFRDFFLFRSTLMLRMLLLLIIASMALFEAARRIGLLAPYPFPILGPPSLTNIAGGLIFGIGMVLAGGCVVGTLYKMGSGSMISATAFLGLIVGSGIYGEIHPWWVTVSKKFTFLKGSITLPQLLDSDPLFLLLPVILVSFYLFYRWSKEKKLHVNTQAEGYLQPWKTALYLSLIGTLSYIFVGMPLGITTAYAKMAAYLELPVIADHVASLAFFNAVPLNYPAPFSHAALKGGAGPAIDAIALIQFPLILGIVFGAFFSAVRIKEFNIYFRVPVRQYVSAFSGGIILALGSRMTPGCNIWHLFGGLPILGMQSILFLIGIFPGAFVGTFILTRLVLPSGQEVL